MHMLFRFILLFLKRNLQPKAKIEETTEIQMRVLPSDLDFLLHMNNGVYFSFMDFGRMDMIYRNGLFDIAQKKGWYGVVAGETIKFKKSLELWNKFTLRTELKGWDERYFYISQKFIYKENVMATGLVKIRFLKKAGGTVSIPEIMAEFKNAPSLQNDELSKEWYDLESKFLA